MDRLLVAFAEFLKKRTCLRTMPGESVKHHAAGTGERANTLIDEFDNDGEGRQSSFVHVTRNFAA